jgi:hypothetical protein
MDRPHHAALTDQEIEAFQNAFDHIPPPHAIQPRFRLNGFFKLAIFAAAFHLLSFETIEPNDPPLVITLLVRDDTPTWTAFESFPLVLTNETSWPVPDLEMPPLALKSLMPRINRNPSAVDIAKFRVTEGPVPREAPSQRNQVSTAAPPPSKTTAPKPPSGSTTQTPRTVSFTDFFSGLVAALKTQSQTLNAPSRTFTAPSRDNFAPSKSPTPPSPHSIGGLLSGLRKG